MKISFSTLGCPGFDWPDIYSMAKDFGFSGIELRGLGGDIFSVHARPFREENLEKTVEQLRALRLEICCLSSGCALRYAEKAEETYHELLEYIDLAEKLSTPYIRILADRFADVHGEVDDEKIETALRRLAPHAE